jgi:hypothetical protein
MASKNQREGELQEHDARPTDASQYGANNTSTSKTILNESDLNSESQSALNPSKPDAKTDSMTAIVSQGKLAFTCFPQLIPEIQIKIWKEVCSVTRNVNLWFHNGSEFSAIWDNLLNPNPNFVVSSYRPLSILSTCREPRAEG